MGTLDATWLDMSHVATCIMLGSMLTFTALYVGRGNWWRDPLGWSIATERTSFVLLLALLMAQEFWPPGIGVEDDFLLAESILLMVASVGVNGGTVIMWRYQQQERKPPTSARHR